MQQIEITKLSGYIEETESNDLIANLILFRGQPVQGNLLPAVARAKRRHDSTSDEREILEQLRLMGASLLPQADHNLLDLLVLSQHFGLKTRLLDWTSNPLAALWFACADSMEGDVFVYRLDADSLLEKNVYDKDPFSTARTRVFQPRHNNPRIVAQDGWFTLHRFSNTAKAFVPLDSNPDTMKHLKELKIPSAHREGLLYSLERHGVSSRTLYPDLGGLCKHLNRKFWKT